MQLRSFRAVVLVLIALTPAQQACGRDRPLPDPTPFAHAPCSVLRGRPCTPSYCSVFNHGPCLPEIDYPYGENLQLTIQSMPSRDDAAKYQKPDHDLDTIGDLFAALRSCWSPPPPDVGQEGMEISVRFSFKRSGEMIGPPRMTYAKAGASPDLRGIYLKAVDSSLDACLPLKFSAGLAGAIAGRPIAIRYVDNRQLAQSSSGQPQQK